jgi:hypothetical protein
MGRCCLLFNGDRHLGIRPVSQLNTWPVVSPVNASRRPSRDAAHHSGSRRLAKPSPWGTFTSYSLPAFPGALRFGSKAPFDCQPMTSVYPDQRTFLEPVGMPFCQEADYFRHLINGHCLKGAISGLTQRSKDRALFDHLVGDSQQRRRHGQPERIRRFQIEDQLEFRRLLHRQFGRIGALENAVDIVRRPPEDRPGRARRTSGRLPRRTAGIDTSPAAGNAPPSL